jgi:alpha-1,3-glucosyltransferase
LLIRIVILLAIFILTNALLWYPWLSSKEHFQSVIQRIFPIRRGLFEDKVASFWCVFNNFYKFMKLWDQPTQIKAATILTLSSCLPSLWYLFRAPTQKQFLLSLFTVSMNFFLFSFHVHEKQILCPLLFFALLLLEFKHFLTITVTVANFSMAQLYVKDKNHINYIALTIGFHYCVKQIEACMINSFKVG